MNFKYNSPMPGARFVDGYAPGYENEGNTFRPYGITGPWENTGVPRSQQGAWERWYRDWPYFINTLSGRLPTPGPLPGTEAYIRRNRIFT